MKNKGSDDLNKIASPDEAVYNISAYIRQSLFMEKYGTTMSTASKVKSIDLLLHIFGLFKPNDYLQYMLWDMESIYIKRNTYDVQAKLTPEMIDDMCRKIAFIYDYNNPLEFTCVCDKHGNAHSTLFNELYSYLETIF